MDVLLALHALATMMMAGLIWFVQLVHYPLFPFVGASDFVRYEREHTRQVTWIVAPLMGLETVAAVALALLVDGATRSWMLRCGNSPKPAGCTTACA